VGARQGDDHRRSGVTLYLASNTMQAMAVVFMTTCVTLKALKIIETVSLLVAIAMGSVLLACSAVLNEDALMAVVMFTIHCFSAMLITVATREGPLRARLFPPLHRRNHRG
jgi:hypothetical protein